MRKIKILYGVEAAHGGVLKHLLYLISNLDKQRFAVTIVLSDLRGNIEEEITFMRLHQVNVIRVPMIRSISLYRDVVSFIRILGVLGRKNYDIVHAHSSKAGALFCVAAWLCGVPKIFYTPHCFFFQSKKGIVKWLYIALEKIIGIFYTGIILSDNEKKKAVHFHVVSDDKIQNINNAIKFEDYGYSDKPLELKERFGIDPKDLVIGAIGRLTLQKDWYTFIYAAREILAWHSNVKFLIVGDGELKQALKDLIIKLNLQRQIILTGFIKEINKIYTILDVFVNTSEWEGLPYVFLEAMYYRLPIVATNTGNDTAVVDGETGFVTETKDYESIASRLKNLINDNGFCEKMGLNAFEHLKEKYSFRAFIELHEKLYSADA